MENMYDGADDSERKHLKEIIRNTVAHFSFERLLELAFSADDIYDRVSYTGILKIACELHEFAKILVAKQEGGFRKLKGSWSPNRKETFQNSREF